MFKTEINLLNRICKTDFFNRLNGRIDNISDYSIIFNEYCDFLMNERYSLLLNEPIINQMNFKFYYEKQDPQQNLFSKFELSRIQQTIKISNILVEPFSSKATYELVKDLDSELESQAYFLDNTEYSFLDVIVFSSLQKCRIWPKLYKDKTKSKKELPQLIDWYKLFMIHYKQEIEYQFDPSIVTSKYQKKLEQQKKERRLDKNLIEAVGKKDYAMIQKLVEEEGSDIESIDQRMYKKPAHIACELGDIELCRFIDQFDCNWESLDTEEQTPIFYAVTSGSLEVVKFLVEEKKVDYQHKEYQDRTPFYLACFLGYMPIVELLYAQGLNINEPSKLKRCALSKACYLGHVDIVKFLVSKPEIDITLSDSKGRTGMHNAAWGTQGGKEGKKRGTIILPDSPQSIEILHDHGHPIDFLDFEGNSPLMSAASSDAKESVRVLINRGADKNLRNVYGECPVFLAARFGHLDILKILINEFGCDWQQRDIKDTSPCEIAAIQQNFDCFDFLVDLELKQGTLNVENFIEKINDDYLNKDDQIKIFDYLNKKINFMEHVKDINKIINFLTRCPNSALMLRVYETVIHELNADHMKSYFLILCQNEKFETAFEMLEMYQKFERSLSLPTRRDIKFEAEDIYTYIRNGQTTMSDENISRLLFKINSDWINYIDTQSNNSILHILCEQRRMKIIVDFLTIIKLRNEDTHSSIDHLTSNTFILNHSTFYTQQFIKQYFYASNTSNLNCLDICLLNKSNDVHHVIDHFLRSFLNEEPYSHYVIPKYTLEILPELESYEHILKKELEQEIEKLQELIKSKSEELKLLNYYSYKDDVNTIERQKNNNCNASSIEQNIQLQYPDRKFLFISNIDSADINILFEQVEKNSIFGIDLEYFSDSKDENIGFVCTIQISTVEMDFVIDAITLRDSLSHLLNKSLFLNPNKTKVLHGCDNDIKWLKNDFNIDIVNLFDTMKAEMIIKNKQQSFSLKNLASEYLGIELDKSFQLSDWRIRPIPALMMNYARVDSFVLLQLFAVMKEMLSQKCLINQMYLGCLKIILKKVEKMHFKNIKLTLQ